MKKIVVILLVLCMCAGLWGCSGASSGITVEAIADELGWGNFSLTAKNDGSGYTFSTSRSVIFGDCIVSGETDSQKNLTKITVKVTDTDASFLDTLTSNQLMTYIKDSGSTPVSRAGVVYLFIVSAQIAKVCSKNTSSDALLDAYDVILAARNKSKEYEGWTYTVRSNTGAETVTMTAIFS